MRIVNLDLLLMGVPPRRAHRWAELRGPIQYYGETPATVRHVLTDLILPARADMDVFDIPRVHHMMDQV
ncbi:MAG: hypothetical protein QN131_14535 [Armatimonadota bacterium]|nr:hypothetical protein [Armatimonadota bacterium]MDR7551129.1 hypothetical protein [Armatimonadota bacterium]